MSVANEFTAHFKVNISLGDFLCRLASGFESKLAETMRCAGDDRLPAKSETHILFEAGALADYAVILRGISEQIGDGNSSNLCRYIVKDEGERVVVELAEPAVIKFHA